MVGVLGPYFSAHFILTPCIFFALFGPAVAGTAFTNLVAAEILTNLHSFAIVVPNHAGEDVYRFETPVKVRACVRVCMHVRVRAREGAHYHMWMGSFRVERGRGGREDKE